jgi:hypothetical protein
MLWFKKNPNQQTTIKEYWQATDAVSRPMAIFLTLLIMFICLAVLFSLFMGGRWLYHNISNQNNTLVEVTDGSGITDIGTSSSSTASSSANGGNKTIGSTVKATPSPTIKPTPATSVSNNSPLPGTGPGELPNTGPGPE